MFIISFDSKYILDDECGITLALGLSGSSYWSSALLSQSMLRRAGCVRGIILPCLSFFLFALSS